MPTKSTTVRLAGLIKLAPLQSNAFKEFVNSTTIDQSLEIEEIKVENGTGDGGNDDIDRRVQALKLTIAARRVSADVLEIALGGPATRVEAGAVPAEVHTVDELGAEIILENLQDASASLTVIPVVDVGDPAPDSYELGVDYERTRLGIRPLEGGAIQVDDEISVSYTKAPHLRVEALLRMATERTVLIDGKNERTGAPWAGLYHRVSFPPAKNLKWYDGNQFASFDLEAEVLIAPWITGNNISRMVKVLVGDDL